MKIIPGEISAYISYNAETGALTWIKDAGPVKAGTELRAQESTGGYVRCRFRGDRYLGHRVAWFLHYGEQPPAVIDHDNRIKSDNRINNLRDGKDRLNAHNREALGYYWLPKVSCFQSSIVRDRKKVHLGLYECPLLARLAYVDEKKKESVIIPLVPSNEEILGRQGDFVRKQNCARPSGLGYTWNNTRFNVYAGGKYVGQRKCPLLARMLRVDKVQEQQGIEIPLLPDCKIIGRKDL